jgi:hypothetical protein
MKLESSIATKLDLLATEPEKLKVIVVCVCVCFHFTQLIDIFIFIHHISVLDRQIQQHTSEWKCFFIGYS